MTTALDTNILSPIWSGAPSATTIAAQLASARSEGALVICAPVFVELSAIPGLNMQTVRRVLAETAIVIDFDLEEDIWMLTAERFAAYSVRRRSSSGGSAKRLLVDFVIGAHALLRADRLMTRDANRYAQDFPSLRLI
jgi:predicted nucleic acid-binding protein